MKRSSGSGLTGVGEAVASGLIPGLGQLINGEGDKAVGVFAVYTVAGLSLLGAIPLIGTLAWAIGGTTWLYAVADAYVTARKKKG